jgi:glutathione S-transferase
MSEIFVYGVPGSPYLRTALLGLEEKGVPYRLHRLSMGGDKAELFQRHPFGRVPVIEHGDFRLYEAQAILRYFDSIFPEPAWQLTEPRALARMNQIIGIGDWYCFPSISAGISWQRLMRPMLGLATEEAVVEAAIPKARTCIAVLEELKAGGTFLVGDRLTIADLMLVPQLSYFWATPEGRTIMAGTSLVDWLAMMEERPSLQVTQPRRLMQSA